MLDLSLSRGEMMKGATIGTFDGVHRGHRLVLDVLKKESASENLLPIAITFDRHPLELIAPDRAPGNLMTTERKTELISSCGVRPVVLPFTEQLRGMTAYEWLQHIYRKFNVRLIVVGYDNTFGSDGIHLSISDYMAMGDSIGIRIMAAPEEDSVSSSAIRKAVKAGDIDSARNMLGHLPELEGRVVAGFHVGSRIGFPTANLQVKPGLLIPAAGVYAAFAHISGEGLAVPAMVNIGIRPTFEHTDSASAGPSVEAHLIGVDKDLYGKDVRLEFAARLRDETRFASVDDLISQLHADREMTLRMCGKN